MRIMIVKMIMTMIMIMMMMMRRRRRIVGSYEDAADIVTMYSI